MSAAVLQFPIRRAIRRRSRLRSSPGSAQVIRFPGRADMDAVVRLASAAGGYCVADPDGDTVFVSGWPDGFDREAFLVCRSGRNLLLLDAQNSADWRLLGTFDDAESLTRALARIAEDRTVED